MKSPADSATHTLDYITAILQLAKWKYSYRRTYGIREPHHKRSSKLSRAISLNTVFANIKSANILLNILPNKIPSAALQYHNY